MIALLAALALLVLCAAAFAEETENYAPEESVGMFDSMWVSDFGEIRAFSMDGYWVVEITARDQTKEWDYLCVYDAEKKALLTEAGGENTKTAIVWDAEGSEANRTVEYTDGAAEFTVNENGKLVWKDAKEDAGAGAEFEKIGWFCGEYACDEFSLSIFWDIEDDGDGHTYSGYRIAVEKMSEGSLTAWAYSGSYNPETGMLDAFPGIKEFQVKDGEPFLEEYNDGEAVFSMDAEGSVRWEDKKENAGEGLVFILSNG
jgi:hypothetical protein